MKWYSGMTKEVMSYWFFDFGMTIKMIVIPRFKRVGEGLKELGMTID